MENLVEGPSGLSVQYPVPWKLLFGLSTHVRHGTQQSVDAFSAGVVDRMVPEPEISGWENLPDNPRFLVVANHFQRKGCWILHPASVITQMVRRHYGPGDPPIRWIVTANWPPIRIGQWKIASPGDILLPKVAHALCCYPVSFAGTNPRFTAASLRRILREASSLNRPIGLFPEGVAGVAGVLNPPLAGVGRLITLLAKAGLCAVPFGIWEDSRLHFRIGSAIGARDLASSKGPAELVMSRIAELLPSP